MNASHRRARLRALLSGDRCLHPASVFDPLSMRAAEALSFEAAMFAGSIASLTVLGAPDLVLLTLSEFADQVRRICRVGEVPLMVDADHGYGNALNARRTVEELEAAGVSALTLEDTVLPRPYGAGDKPQLTSIEEGQGKLRAALAGRQDPSLVVVGRTSAIGITGVEDTIARLKAYEEAGVDALFMAGVKTRAQLDAVAAAVNLPLILGSAGAEVTDLDYLAARGVRICLQGHLPFMAAVNAVYETLRAQRAGVPNKDIPGVAPDALMKRLTRHDDYDAWTRDWLGAW
jgi:carboxyvinyl-carboxyphosphonate phosphorylmutase